MLCSISRVLPRCLTQAAVSAAQFSLPCCAEESHKFPLPISRHLKLPLIHQHTPLRRLIDPSFSCCIRLGMLCIICNSRALELHGMLEALSHSTAPLNKVVQQCPAARPSCRSALPRSLPVEDSQLTCDLKTLFMCDLCRRLSREISKGNQQAFTGNQSPS